MECFVLNKCVPKYPLSPLFCISRKSTLTFRGLAGAITTESCSWEKEKRNIIVAASFLVSAKQTAERSWEVDNVGRTDRSLHSSGAVPEEQLLLVAAKSIGIQNWEENSLCSTHQIWGVYYLEQICSGYRRSYFPFYGVKDCGFPSKQ